MEPQWTKQIPAWAVCNWYYLLFIINLSMFIILILSGIAIMLVRGGDKYWNVTTIILYLFSGTFAATNALFYYLICDRSLKPTQ